ncbi:MAG: hypothetical protein JNK58_04575 [Phycisphaerae bacterium]|nr:hypothetical protein [Phycisphaerae bacterium]
MKSANHPKSPSAKRTVAAAGLALLVLATTASAQWPDRPRTKPPAPAKSTTPAAPPPSKRDAPSEESPPLRLTGWSIVLESHTGSDAVARAQARLAAVSNESGRSDVRVRATGRGAAIVAGAYRSPDAPEARADLALVRARVVGDRMPFSQAFFAPPPETVDPGLAPEVNLLAAKQVFGKDKEYTLQIAFYQSKKPEEAKRAAEQAALQLRRDGELAFYYHGPTMSLVTVGVFSDSDFDQGLRPKTAAILALQERYPLNLHNGQFPVIEKRPGAPDTKQSSQLVKIP